MPPTAPPTTRFTELVGCRLPIQQAGMGGVSTPALAAAVADAGALGMLGAAGLPPGEVVRQLREATAGGGMVGVNFLVPFLDLAALEAAAADAPVIECFYGPPDGDVVDRVHAAGALMAWQVGDVDEARAAADVGCDLIVVQGVEAGGHVRGTTPLLPLLEDTRRRLPDRPLVAAGGIGDGATLARVLDAGADAGRIGTRLLATTEADVHPDYLARLVDAGADDTVRCEAFALGWPGAPHRVLRSCIEAGSTLPPDRRSTMPPTRAFGGEVAAAALYAGTSVAGVRRVVPAAQVIDELVSEASASSSA